MRPKTPLLAPQELEIMKVVWDHESSTVRDVYEALRQRRKVAYTTVMTMMNTLEQKGYLRRRRQDRAYLYRATHARKQVIRAMVRDFVDRVFNGAAEPLVVHLVEDRRLSERELREIARMIKEGR
jgi:BlaI family transcriptional regulator, penicillinase repressor